MVDGVPRSLPISNPWSRFVTTATEYDDGEAPPATYEVQEDHSKSILSGNDSPDVGFRWSVNPYRGCLHACSYCIDGDTRILMAGGSTRALRDLRVGDEIYGTRLEGAYRRYTRTTVLAHWQSVKRAYRITLADGTELIAGGDHRFLTDRGWKYVIGREHGKARRPFLTTSNRLIGTGAFATEAPLTQEYERGDLTGMVRGDALLKTFRYSRPGRAHGDQHQFRLALVDFEALDRTQAYLQRWNVPTRGFVFASIGRACGGDGSCSSSSSRDASSRGATVQTPAAMRPSSMLGCRTQAVTPMRRATLGLTRPPRSDARRDSSRTFVGCARTACP
jgi:hypothetical protein